MKFENDIKAGDNTRHAEKEGIKDSQLNLVALYRDKINTAPEQPRVKSTADLFLPSLTLELDKPMSKTAAQSAKVVESANGTSSEKLIKQKEGAVVDRVMPDGDIRLTEAIQRFKPDADPKAVQVAEALLNRIARASSADEVRTFLTKFLQENRPAISLPGRDAITPAASGAGIGIDAAGNIVFDMRPGSHAGSLSGGIGSFDSHGTAQQPPARRPAYDPRLASDGGGVPGVKREYTAPENAWLPNQGEVKPPDAADGDNSGAPPPTDPFAVDRSPGLDVPGQHMSPMVDVQPVVQKAAENADDHGGGVEGFFRALGEAVVDGLEEIGEVLEDIYDALVSIFGRDEGDGAQAETSSTVKEEEVGDGRDSGGEDGEGDEAEGDDEEDGAGDEDEGGDADDDAEDSSNDSEDETEDSEASGDESDEDSDDADESEEGEDDSTPNPYDETPVYTAEDLQKAWDEMMAAIPADPADENCQAVDRGRVAPTRDMSPVTNPNPEKDERQGASGKLGPVIDVTRIPGGGVPGDPISQSKIWHPSNF